MDFEQATSMAGVASRCATGTLYIARLHLLVLAAYARRSARRGGTEFAMFCSVRGYVLEGSEQSYSWSAWFQL